MVQDSGDSTELVGSDNRSGAKNDSYLKVYGQISRIREHREICVAKPLGSLKGSHLLEMESLPRASERQSRLCSEVDRIPGP